MSYDTVNPANGQVEHTQHTLDAAAIEARLAASAKAFAQWAALPLAERGALLRRVGEELTRRRDDLQRIMTAEMGKLRHEALAEVDKCAQGCAYYAEHAADYLAPRDIPTEAQSSYVRYEPLGCVFAVMPWNFPLWQAFRFLAPGLMAGNVALLKHASNVPRCADAMKEVLDAAGIPPGVFDVLHIDNDQAADVLRDDRIAAVTLTGSERAGRSLAANAGDQLKKCVMELGGSDAFVVLEDADLEHTVASAVQSRFDNSGQTCIAAKRFIVVDAIADRFIERFVAAASKRVLGDPQQEGTTLAPMARADLRDELHKQVQHSVEKGAKVLLAANRCPVRMQAIRPPSSIMSPRACRPTRRSFSARSHRSFACGMKPRRYAWPTTPASASAAACGPPMPNAASAWRSNCSAARRSSIRWSRATCGYRSAASNARASAASWPSTASTSS